MRKREGRAEPRAAKRLEGHVLEIDRLGAVVRDERPWGSFERFTLNEPSTVKIITVQAGQTLSLQRHEHRDELWVALDPGLVFEIDGDVTRPEVGDRVLIRAGQTHRLSCAGDAPARILEIAFGHFDEEDIERLEDAYGRA